MAEIIKKYIYLSGAKLNDRLYIDYVLNVFKFTKILANEHKNHLIGINKHINVKGYQT